MRPIVYTAVALVLSFDVALGQSSWTKMTTSTSKQLLGIRFRTQLAGWAVGEDGVVLHTSDGGVTWTEDSVDYDGTKPVLMFVEPQDSLNVWTGHWESPWFRSTDGGTTWTSGWIDSIANISRVVFPAPQLAFAAGFEVGGSNRGRILKSTDGGETWNAILDTASRGFYDVCFVDSLFGVAVGAITPVFDNFDPGTAYRTTNGGDSWEEVGIFSGGQLGRVNFANNSVGWADGGNGRLLRTTDGGISWTHEGPSISVSWFSSVATPGPSQVWVTPPFSDALYHSTDYGSSWTTISFPTGSRIFGLFFLDECHGWAVGDSGAVWKYDNVTEVATNSTQEFPTLTSTNYPNPFNPTTRIRFSLQRNSFVIVRVYDVIGRLITTLANSYYDYGLHEVEFQAGNLPSGIYIYVLTTQAQIQRGKMVLSR